MVTSEHMHLRGGRTSFGARALADGVGARVYKNGVQVFSAVGRGLGVRRRTAAASA